MGILVTDQGFARDDWQPAILTFDQLRLSDTGGHAVSLAPDFDLKAFHDELLTRGAVPLTILGDDS